LDLTEQVVAQQLMVITFLEVSNECLVFAVRQAISNFLSQTSVYLLQNTLCDSISAKVCGVCVISRYVDIINCINKAAVFNVHCFKKPAVAEIKY